MDDLQHIRELSREAKEITDSEAYQVVTGKIKKRLDGELLQAKTSEEKLDLVNQLKMLEFIKIEFESLINDYKLAVKRHG